MTAVAKSDGFGSYNPLIALAINKVWSESQNNFKIIISKLKNHVNESII